MKKILVGGSIVVVILLILCSLMNVIGFQITTTTAVKSSPLFEVRTKKAINEKSEFAATYDYIGKNKQSSFSFPMRDNKIILLEKVLNKIKLMDDASFEKFVNSVTSYNHKNAVSKDISDVEIEKELNTLRVTPNEIILYNIDTNNNKMPLPEPTSSDMHTICRWAPGCLFWLIFILPIQVLIWFIEKFLSNFTLGPCY
jgi:hypothetical protein